MNLVRPEEGSHWYRPDGSPCYEVPKARGGGTRFPTARDARALGLLPSVTGIVRMINRPQLQAWIINQHVMAAVTIPRQLEDTADSLAQRVVRDARAQVEAASNFGSRMHEAIELYLQGDTSLPEGTLSSDIPYIGGIRAWLDGNPIVVEGLEQTFASVELGFGGRIDCIGSIEPYGRLVIDWKTQQTQPGKPFRHYPEHGIQLAAYVKALEGEEITGGLNLLISSTEPGRVEPYLWLDMDRCWEAFEHCIGLYYGIAGPGKKLRSTTKDGPELEDEEEE